MVPDPNPCVKSRYRLGHGVASLLGGVEHRHFRLCLEEEEAGLFPDPGALREGRSGMGGRCIKSAT